MRLPIFPATSMLPAIVLLGFALRAMCAILFSGQIDEEGAEYARIAQNLLEGRGYIGIANDGTQLIFPPLFPFLLLGFLSAGMDVDTAGRVLDVLFGSGMIVGVYCLAGRLFGPAHAVLAAILVSLHPFLVRFSTTIHCELVYLAITVLAVYTAMVASESSKFRVYAATGLLYGLAYLVRPEAALFVLVSTAFILISRAVTTRQPLRSIARQEAGRVATLLACFGIVAAPYVAWLSWQTGELRLQVKTPLNVATELRMQSGQTLYSASYAIGENLEVQGIWAMTNLQALQMPRPGGNEMLRMLAKKSLSVAQNAAANVGGAIPFGAPLLFGLAVVGLLGRTPSRRQFVDHLHLMMLAALSLVALFFIYYSSPRFYLFVLISLIIWASAGLFHFAAWSGRVLVRNRILEVSHSRLRSLAIAAAIAAMLLPAAAFELRELLWARSTRSIKAFADTFAANEPIRIADTTSQFALHAKAQFTWLPYTQDGHVALRYLEKMGVTHVVLNGERLDQIPYLETWARSGIPGATLVTRLDRPGGKPTWIYRLSADH